LLGTVAGTDSLARLLATAALAQKMGFSCFMAFARTDCQKWQRGGISRPW
jgi:hypothetical protein